MRQQEINMLDDDDYIFDDVNDDRNETDDRNY